MVYIANNSISEAELSNKNCPFCANDSVYEFTDYTKSRPYMLICPVCEVVMSGKTLAQVREKWDRRDG